VLADVDVGGNPVAAPRAARPRVGHHHRRRLRAALPGVAARRVPGRERFDQAIRQVAIARCRALEALGHGRQHLRPHQQIALGHVVGSGAVAGPGIGPLPGVLGTSRPRLEADHADLSPGGARVRGDRPPQRLRSREPLRQPVEQLVAVLGARVGLGGHRAHARAHPRDAVTHARDAGRHRHADLAGRGVNRGDGEGRELQLGLPCHRFLAPRVERQSRDRERRCQPQPNGRTHGTSLRSREDVSR